MEEEEEVGRDEERRKGHGGRESIYMHVHIHHVYTCTCIIHVNVLNDDFVYLCFCRRYVKVTIGEMSYYKPEDREVLRA